MSLKELRRQKPGTDDWLVALIDEAQLRLFEFGPGYFHEAGHLSFPSETADGRPDTKSVGGGRAAPKQTFRTAAGSHLERRTSQHRRDHIHAAAEMTAAWLQHHPYTRLISGGPQKSVSRFNDEIEHLMPGTPQLHLGIRVGERPSAIRREVEKLVTSREP